MTLRTGLVITGDSAGAKQAVNDLDNSLKRAEADAVKMGASTGVVASKMARDAQIAAAGIGTVGRTSALAAYQAQNLAFQLNDVVTGLASGQAPMRVFAQQGGQFYQIMQQSGMGARGFAVELLSMIGVLRITTDAMAAANAAAAKSALGGAQGAFGTAAGKVSAADTELLLAEAQLRVAATSEAATAAQARLAAAHEGVAAAAAELTIAEDALAIAEGRAATAAAEAKAATIVSLGPVAGILAGVAIAGGLVLASFKAMQMQVQRDHTLDDYANSLGLTTKEMKKLREEVGGLTSKEMQDLDARAQAFQITWGDVFNGVKKTASDALNLSPAWQRFKDGYVDAFSAALGHAINFAAQSYGIVVGAYDTIVQTWKGFGPAIGHAVAQAANAALGSIEGLINKSIDAMNRFASGVNELVGKQILGTIGHVDLGRVKDNYANAGKNAGKSFAENVAAETAKAKAQIEKNVATLFGNIIGAAEQRIANAANSIIEDRTPKRGRQPKKPNDHGNAEALAELDAQIRGQLRLAAAYQVSDAAVIKAEALQKAEEEAIRHKGDVAIYYEKELRLAVAQGLADGSKRLADLKVETAARQKANDMVAAGIITASQANDQLQLESELRPLLARLEVADAQTRGEILNVIQATIAAHKDLNAQLSREQLLRDMAANDNDIERLRLEATLIGHSNRERAVALAQLEAMQKLRTMPGLSPQDQQAFIQSYIDKANAAVRTPFQEWADSVPQTADAVNASLESIATRGFDSLASGIADVLDGTKSLRDVFHDVAAQILSDLIQMTIKMLIFRAIMSAIGGVGAGGGGGSGVPGDAFSTIDTSFKGNAFSQGSILPFRKGGIVDRLSFFPMRGGRMGSMAEDGPEAIVPLARDSQGRLGIRGGAPSSSGPSIGSVTINADFRGADAESVGAINSRLDRMEQELPGQIVKTMQDARSRFLWR